jgi:DDE superfamily endonuclease
LRTFRFIGKLRRKLVRQTIQSGRRITDLFPSAFSNRSFRSKNPLSATDKARNCAISSERVPCENVIAMLKRFKIIADRYRNRRRRFGLRFFLIAAIYNMELKVA